MSIDIEKSFVKQFEAEVHIAFQQQGTKLKPTIRCRENVVGGTCVFARLGTSQANTKTRHEKIITTNISHDTADCILEDFYTGDWVDRLDEMKTNIDERRVVALVGANALGRKIDELIIKELNKSTTTIPGEAALNKQKIFEAVEMLNKANVPDDGNRFAVIGVRQYSELLGLKEFTSSEYVGDDLPFLKNSEVKKWLGINWIIHNGLPFKDSKRTCFFYHKNAVGLATGSDIKTDITWHGDRASYFIANSMSCGATIIDPTGIVKMECKES